MIENNFLTKSKFTKLIEKTVSDLNIPYMEAILHVCDKNDIEPEDVKKFISPIIKGKVVFKKSKSDRTFVSVKPN